MRAILSLILAAIMAISAGVQSADPTLAEEPGQENSLVGINWEDLEYEHIDPEPFYAQTDQLAALAEQDDPEAVIALFDSLYAQLDHILTMSVMASVKYSAAVTDEYWTEENLYSDELYTEAADALCTAAHAVTEGPCAEAFAQHVGDISADYYAGYVPMTDRESELFVQEDELVDQYYEAMAGNFTYEYDGKTWDMDMLNGIAGQFLAQRDYNGYLEVYNGLQKAMNDAAGSIFTQLVAVRAEIAQIEGYDSYADLAYEQVYGRDYTCQDAQVFCDAVKALGPEYYESLYFSDLWDGYDAAEPVMDSEQLLAVLKEYAPKIDSMLLEPLDYMIDHGMYDIGVGDDRMAVDYTISLPELQCPFLFIDQTGTCFDLGTVCHEFGHFTNDYYNPTPDFITTTDCFDLLEIHSTGLEMLFTNFYDDIYTEGADTARFVTLDKIMTSVFDGCIHDEFQRRVYAQPDMTLEEINQLYTDICAEYGVPEYFPVDYTWVQVSHDFEQPMYYISYAASALAAIQIWDMAREDLQAGVDVWKAVLATGGHNVGYMTVLPQCGLRLFTEEGAVEEICRPLLDEMARMDAEDA